MNLVGIIGFSLYKNSSLNISTDSMEVQNNLKLVDTLLKFPEPLILQSQIKFNSSTK